MQFVFVLLFIASHVLVGLCHRSIFVISRSILSPEEFDTILPRTDNSGSSKWRPAHWPGPLERSVTQRQRLRKETTSSEKSPNLERSPGPRKSSSSSQDWNKGGLSTSSSSSEGRSDHSEERQRSPASAKIWVKGPAIVRTRDMKSRGTMFLRIPSKATAYQHLTSADKTQASVRILGDDGHAGIVGSGLRTRITVNARKSKSGGWVGNIDDDGRTANVQPVQPGQKLKLDSGDHISARGFIRGKGNVKATSTLANAETIPQHISLAQTDDFDFWSHSE